MLLWVLAFGCPSTTDTPRAGPAAVQTTTAPRVTAQLARNGLQSALQAWTEGDARRATDQVVATYQAHITPLEPLVTPAEERLRLEYRVGQLLDAIARGNDKDVRAHLAAIDGTLSGLAGS